VTLKRPEKKSVRFLNESDIDLQSVIGDDTAEGGNLCHCLTYVSCFGESYYFDRNQKHY
jgi:hypothetical protein